MSNGELDYLVFILRLYRVRGQPETQSAPTGTIWRVSLESPRTRERHGFASLGELFDFLKKEIGHAAQDEVAPSDS